MDLMGELAVAAAIIGAIGTALTAFICFHQLPAIFALVNGSYHRMQAELTSLREQLDASRAHSLERAESVPDGPVEVTIRQNPEDEPVPVKVVDNGSS